MTFKGFTRQHSAHEQRDTPEAADSRPPRRLSTPTHYSGSPSPDTDTRLAPDYPGSAANRSVDDPAGGQLDLAPNPEGSGSARKVRHLRGDDVKSTRAPHQNPLATKGIHHSERCDPPIVVATDQEDVPTRAGHRLHRHNPLATSGRSMAIRDTTMTSEIRG